MQWCSILGGSLVYLSRLVWKCWIPQGWAAQGMLENMKFHLFSLRMSTTSTKTCWVNGWTGLSESFSSFNHSRILKETLRIIFLTATECQTCTQRGRHPKCCISFGFYTKKSPGKSSRRDLNVSSGESWAVLNDVQFHCNISVEMKGLFQPQWFHEPVIQSPDKVHFSPGDWELWGEIQWHGRAFRSFKQKFLMWSQFVVELFSLIVVVLVTSWLTKCSLKFQLCKKKKWFKKNCGEAAGEALQDSPGPRGLNWRWNLPHLEPAALNPSQTPQESRGLFAFPAWVLFFQTANPLFEFPFPSPRTSSSQDLGFRLCSCQEKHFGLGSAWAQPSSALFALQLVPLCFNPKLTLHNAFCGRWGEEQAGD